MARNRAVLIVGLALLMGGLSWWVVTVTRMAPADRGNASGYGQFVLAAIGLVLTIWQVFGTRLLDRRTDSEMAEWADQLAVAVRAQWTGAAIERGLLHAPMPIRWRRCAERVAGPVNTATTPRSMWRSFEPLPGMDRITPAQLRQGTHRMLHRVYGGLASGRLILTGGPGTGKSSAAILLLLDALDYRDHAPSHQRAHVPVPVLFTLHGWNPAKTPVHEWLVTKLAELPTLGGQQGRDHAAQLLTAGRIAVILDGLDEIPKHHRPAALQALARQAAFRLVLLARTPELVTASHDHILTGAVALQLQSLTSTDAATYLQHGLPDTPPAPWQRLLTALTLTSDAPIVSALDNPLTITLLRDIYQPPLPENGSTGPVDELLDTARFPTPQHITNHLLDQFIITAYTPRPGRPEPRYTARAAHHTLTLIAAHLRDHNSRDLRWWDIPALIPSTHLFIIALFVDYVAIFGCMLAGAIVGGSRFSAVGLIAGMLAFVGSGGMKSISSAWDTPGRIGRFRWDGWDFGFGLVSGLGLGAFYGLFMGMAFGRSIGISAGVAVGLAFGLAFVLTAGCNSGDSTKVAYPRDLWRLNMVSGLTAGLGFGLSAGLGLGLAAGLASGLDVGLKVGLVSGLVLGPVYGLAFTKAGSTAISQIYLAIRYGTSLRLCRFLQDAHARHLLRTVGPIYQFRHATLQDRLAPPIQ